MAVYRLVFAALGVVAVIAQLSVHIDHHYSVPNFFSYFTNLGNIISIMVFVIGALRLLRGVPSTRGWEIVRFCSTVNMVFIGLVFNILLVDTDLGDLLPWVNVVMHMLLPALALVDWIILPPQRRQAALTILAGLLFPIAYSVYSLVRGAIIGFYPYPFYNPRAVGGAGAVALYMIVLVIGLAVLSFLVWLIGRARTRRQPA